MYLFSEILGNSPIVNVLKNAILKDKINHSYIINGGSGFGKTHLAKTFTKSILCKNLNKNGDACCICDSCIKFNSGNNPDVIYVESEKKSIGISDIRELVIKNAEIKPFLYRYKVFIIENADTMTIQSQNSILKTIEDGHKFCIFIFVSTNYNLFLSTILSRCITLKLNPINKNTIKTFLVENNNIDDVLAETYANYSQGSLGQAIKICQSKDFFEIREFSLKLLNDLEKVDLIGIYKNITEMENYKLHTTEILDIFILTYRDVIMYKIYEFEKIIQKDKLCVIENIANLIKIKNIIFKISTIISTKEQLNQNGNFQMSMEAMFFRLKEK